jgi:hypothetical protein
LGALQTSFSQAGHSGGANEDLVGVLYFNLRSANEHVIKDQGDYCKNSRSATT